MDCWKGGWGEVGTKQKVLTGKIRWIADFCGARGVRQGLLCVLRVRARACAIFPTFCGAVKQDLARATFCRDSVPKKTCSAARGLVCTYNLRHLRSVRCYSYPFGDQNCLRAACTNILDITAEGNPGSLLDYTWDSCTN